MTDPVPPSEPRAVPVRSGSGRLMRWALFVSLALNLAVAGMLVGAMLRGGAGDTDVRAASADMGALWLALPDTSRAALRQAMTPPDGPRPTPPRAERRAHAQAMNAHLLALIRAEPFDPDALATWLRDDHASRAVRVDRALAALATEIARLTPEQRAEMAQRLERRLSRRAPPR